MRAALTAANTNQPDPIIRKRGRPLAEVEKMLPLWDKGGIAYFGYRVVLSARLFERRIAEFLAETATITLPEWRVMAQLGVIPQATVRMLADGAAVDRAEVSRAARRLTDRGLVRRIENAADLRSPKFELTDAGIAEVERIRGPIYDYVRKVTRELDHADILAADRVLWAMTSGFLDPDHTATPD